MIKGNYFLLIGGKNHRYYQIEHNDAISGFCGLSTIREISGHYVVFSRGNLESISHTLDEADNLAYRIIKHHLKKARGRHSGRVKYETEKSIRHQNAR